MCDCGRLSPLADAVESKGGLSKCGIGRLVSFLAGDNDTGIFGAPVGIRTAGWGPVGTFGQRRSQSVAPKRSAIIFKSSFGHLGMRSNHCKDLTASKGEIQFVTLHSSPLTEGGCTLLKLNFVNQASLKPSFSLLPDPFSLHTGTGTHHLVDSNLYSEVRIFYPWRDSVVEFGLD